MRMGSIASLTTVVVAGALLLAGCASGGMDAADDQAPAETPGTEVAADQAILDKLTPEGYLKTPAEVSVNLPSLAIIDLLAPVMADELGILEKYGITLTVQTGSTTNAIPMLATGKLDSVVGGLNAGVFNSITDGSDIRVALPFGHLGPAANTGLFVSSAWLDGREFAPELLDGATHASSLGAAGVTIVQYTKLLEEGGLSVDDIEVVTMPEADQIIALENGAIATGTLSEVAATAALEGGAVERMSSQVPDGWPPVVLLFGPSIYEDRPEVGYAYAAAMRELFVNHLQGPWLEDPEMIDALVAGTGNSADTYEGITPYEFPTVLELPADYISGMDTAWRLFEGTLTSESPLTEADIVDPRFMEFANGLDF